METCPYCYQWHRSYVISKTETTNSKIKDIIRLCKLKNKDINTNSESCELFEPCSTFFCNKFGQFIAPAVCINRHNIANFSKGQRKKMYSECKICKQHKQFIKPMCDKFLIITPQISKIKVRSGFKSTIKTRIIKTRSKSTLIKTRNRG